MIIKIFKISTKEMYTFKNKIELLRFVRQITKFPILYNKTISQLVAYLPVDDYYRVR
jgi:hypothetical protein